MRVHKTPPYIPSTVLFSEIVDLENNLLADEQEPLEGASAVLATELFRLLQPGEERICIVLRADGFTYGNIADIMGITESKVKNIVYTIRKRILEERKVK